MRFLLALLLTLACSPTWAADTVLPSPGKAVGVVTSDVAGEWGVLASDFSTTIEPQVYEGGKVCVFEAPPGRYAVIQSAAGKLKIKTVNLGTPAPIPTPVPTPIPVPTPTPEPTPNPTPAGSRTVLLIRESADANPNVARLIANLRSGQPAEYLKSKGHRLYILDDDSSGADGSPARIVELWRPHFKDMQLPALIIADDDGHLLYKVELSATATDADVLNHLKNNGG